VTWSELGQPHLHDAFIAVVVGDVGHEVSEIFEVVALPFLEILDCVLVRLVEVVEVMDLVDVEQSICAFTVLVELPLDVVNPLISSGGFFSCPVDP